MSDIIIPGEHGISSRGFTPIKSGYDSAAFELVKLMKEGRYIDESDPNVANILYVENCSSLDDLKIKFRV